MANRQSPFLADARTSFATRGDGAAGLGRTLTRAWRRSCLGLAGTMAAMSAAAGEAPASAAFVDLRYRYSNLYSQSAPLRGHANTVRLQFGYRWALGNGWSAYAEGIAVRSLFGRQYDDTSGRRLPYPVEADPKSTGLTNAWLEYRNDDVRVRVGRQYVVMDGGRFISSNGWRQTSQSFDGVGVAWKAWDGAELRYHWLDQVNRTVGEDFPDRQQRRWKLSAHLLHLDQALPLGKLTAYGYFIRNSTRPVNSVRTLGLRWSGTRKLGPEGASLGWIADVARQHDYGNNPAQFSLGYHLAEVSYGYAPFSLKAGEERLDGNGRTPLNVAYGAARAFNGWVGAFRIPVAGLRDRYAGAFGSLPLARKASWQVVYRHFTPVLGGPALGNEFDAGVLFDVGSGVTLEMQYGDYRARGYGVDERKLWLIAQYRFGRQP